MGKLTSGIAAHNPKRISTGKISNNCVHHLLFNPKNSFMFVIEDWHGRHVIIVDTFVGMLLVISLLHVFSGADSHHDSFSNLPESI
jgi:hypothetical protein